MSGLSEFLLARIAEDEHRAKCAAMEIPQVRESGEVWGVWIGKKWYRGSAFASHTDHWMPARVLAECDAKRQIVEHSRAATEEHKRAVRAAPVVATPGRALRQGEDQTWWAALRLLALPYAEHPDYREEWRP